MNGKIEYNTPRIKNSAWCAEESIEEEVWKSSMLHVFILGVCSFRIAPGVRGEGVGWDCSSYIHTYFIYLESYTINSISTIFK